MRGWTPSWRRTSIRSTATAIPATRLSTSASSSPASVNTERLWSASECTSRSAAAEPNAAASAAIVFGSRPSETLGTDSSGNTGGGYDPARIRATASTASRPITTSLATHQMQIASITAIWTTRR